MGTGAGAMRTINYRYAEDSDTFKHIDAVIQQNLAVLRKDGVLTVRPGYQMVGGWPTQKPAIVVTVRQKSDAVPAAQLLPEMLGGYAVDVRQASSIETLRADDP